MPPTTRRTITTEDAANLANVGVSTIRSWIKDGRLPSDEVEGSKSIDLDVFRGTKLLRDKQLLSLPALMKLNVEQRDLANAIAEGAVSPSPGRGRCFSLDDADVLAKFKQGAWTPAPETNDVEVATEKHLGSVDSPADTPENARDFLVRSGRWQALRAYMTQHKDPFKLPPSFWDTRTCPDFIPPAGVFRFVYGTIYQDEEGNPCTAIKRSEGWIFDEASGTPHFVPRDDGHDFVGRIIWPPGTEPPEYRGHNLRWSSAKRDWEDAWLVRRRQLRSEGIDATTLPELGATNRRSRAEVLDLYRQENLPVSDLPDWFWDVPECPLFEAPPSLARYEYGEQTSDPNGSGRLGTWVRRTAIWQQPMGDALFHDPADERVEWVPGAFECGTVPAKFEHLSRDYDSAAKEWEEEYRLRARKRGV